MKKMKKICQNDNFINILNFMKYEYSCSSVFLVCECACVSITKNNSSSNLKIVHAENRAKELHIGQCPIKITA